MRNDELFLQEIFEKLKIAIEELNGSILSGAKDIESMNDYYWQNYTEMDEYGYENYDNKRVLMLEMGANEERLLLRTRYRKMLGNPYFGRVDFVYEGEDEPEQFYIGIGNFSEKKGMQPLIFDWRAPVSALFYDYDCGPASYTAPGGVMDGTIVGKGQYKIRGGKVIYAIDNEVTIDDEVLVRELSDKGETHLKNIISTIQKEQNVIIRNTVDPILVIQGVAGSGKTSVALHRIAYLLYHDREHLHSKNILILSPNDIFSDYISHILPELGEENIMEMSFDTFAYRELREIVFDMEDRSDLMEALLCGAANPYGFLDKQGHEFLSMMEAYALELEDFLLDSKDIEIRRWVKSAREIEKLFYSKFTDFPLLSRMDVVREHVIDEYETLTGVTLEQEELDYLKAEFESMFSTTDLYVIYSRFLEDMGFEPLPHLPYEKRKLRYADVYPMLYMKYLLMSRQDHKQIKHLVIDEMQDYSYLQYRILEKLFHCRMTILGDRAQTLDSGPRDVKKFLPEILGKNIRMLELTKSYRNTVEIAKYANSVIGEKDAQIFERHGSEVSVSDFDAKEEYTDTLLDELLGFSEAETLAVITFTEKEAEETYRCLMGEMELRGERGEESVAGLEAKEFLSFVNRDSRHFSTGVTVIPYYLAKGLEFEQVWFLDHPKYTDEIHNQARYIAATRALHGLHVFRIAD